MSHPLTPLTRTSSFSPAGSRVPFDTGSVSVSSSQYNGTYTWTIRKYSQITERKILSEEFEIGTYSWRLLVFPRGNDNRGKDKAETVAAYLCFRHAPFTPEFLSPKVKFELTAVNQKYPDRSITLETQHVFSKRYPDWGFTQIAPIHELQDPDYGFLLKDSVVFRVCLTVIPRHIPRNETGLIGLAAKDEAPGLNAVIQVLFHLPYLRKAIYNVDSVESLSTGTRLPHAMRRLFFKLQYQNSTASATEIVETLDHCDPRKTFANFVDKLMLELMGSNVESVVPNLFEGKSLIYTESAGEETKIVTEAFKQIELKIDGCKDIYEALEKLCKVSRADDMKNGHRYKLFDTLPSILSFQLHSKYSASDFADEAAKGRPSLQLVEDLNLDYGGKRFFAPSATSSSARNTYTLHAVFFSPLQGNDFVFVKRENLWFRFEDELVEEVEAKDVLSLDPQEAKGVVTSLLYVRSSDRAQIMWETSCDDIAQPIRRQLESDLLVRQRDLSEKMTANAHIVINVATEYDFQKPSITRKVTEIVDLDSVKRYRLPKDVDFEEFRSQIAADFKVSSSGQRYWLWKSDASDSAKLDKHFPPLAVANKKLLSLNAVRDPVRSADERSNALMVVNVFLELPPPTTSVLPEIQPNEILLFFKFYDPLKIDLDFVGSLYAGYKTTFGTIIERAKDLARCHKDLKLTASRLVAVEPKIVICDIFAESTPYQYNLVSGDVIIIQPKMVSLVDFMKKASSRGTFEDDSTFGQL